MNSPGIRTSAEIVKLSVYAFSYDGDTAYWLAYAGIGILTVTTVVIRIRTKSLIPVVAGLAGYKLIIVITVFVGSTRHLFKH